MQVFAAHSSSTSVWSCGPNLPCCCMRSYRRRPKWTWFASPAEHLRSPSMRTARLGIKERYIVSAPLGGELLRVDLHPGYLVHTGKTVLAAIERAIQVCWMRVPKQRHKLALAPLRPDCSMPRLSWIAHKRAVHLRGTNMPAS